MDQIRMLLFQENNNNNNNHYNSGMTNDLATH